MTTQPTPANLYDEDPAEQRSGTVHAGLDPAAFDPKNYAADVIDHNEAVAAATRGAPWPPPSVEAYRASLESTMAARLPGGELYRSPDAAVTEIPVGGGTAGARIIASADSRGLCIHMHGGGWTIGSASYQDASLERVARATGLSVASIEYRLAPEFPFPTPLDDCEQAVRWLIAELDPPAVVLLAESAGATLALSTALRLRDRPADQPIAALSLFYGVYDLRMTPRMANGGGRGGIPTTEMMNWFIAQYLPDPRDRAQAAASPLLADLDGLPATLLTTGSEDPLLEDSLFLYTRLLAARVPVEISLVPGAGHLFDTAALSVTGPALRRSDEFLRARL